MNLFFLLGLHRKQMKQLTLKLIIPLSVISFATLTKWWYALPVDAPGTYLTGFPFPFVCNGWHTSMSLQIFAIEFFVDFLTYFLIWFLVFFLHQPLLEENQSNEMADYFPVERCRTHHLRSEFYCRQSRP